MFFFPPSDTKLLVNLLSFFNFFSADGHVDDRVAWHINKFFPGEHESFPSEKRNVHVTCVSCFFLFIFIYNCSVMQGEGSPPPTHQTNASDDTRVDCYPEGAFSAKPLLSFWPWGTRVGDKFSKSFVWFVFSSRPDGCGAITVPSVSPSRLVFARVSGIQNGPEQSLFL